MKTIYLQDTKNDDLPFFNPYFYKVVEVNKELTKTLQVTKDSIELGTDEDFHNQVSFIKNKLCENSFDEISREKFDDFYKKTVEKINNYSKL